MSRRFALLLPFLLMLHLPTRVAAQSPIGVALHAGVSHSGWNIALVAQYMKGRANPYLGPSISLNRGLPGRIPMGINAGLDWRIPSHHDWLDFVLNLDHQWHAFPGKDQIHETALSYGLRFQLPGGFFLSQQLGYGIYLERAYIEAQNRRESFSGYNGLVRVRAGYNF